MIVYWTTVAASLLIVIAGAWAWGRWGTPPPGYETPKPSQDSAWRRAVSAGAGAAAGTVMALALFVLGALLTIR